MAIPAVALPLVVSWNWIGGDWDDITYVNTMPLVLIAWDDGIAVNQRTSSTGVDCRRWEKFRAE